MAEPVTADDGGSIRIREIAPNNKMDGLLDGKANANNAAATPYHNLRIQHHFKDGTNHLHPAGGGVTPLNPGDVITITSGSGQIVVMTLLSAVLLQIDLTTGSAASVEGRTQRGQRVYRITNADVIQTVALNGVAIFDNTLASASLPSALTIVTVH